MVDKVLITTALEETWAKDNEESIFLGEWCLKYNKRKKWESLTYQKVDYHWNDRAKLYSDYKFLLEFYEKTLTDITNDLNKYHNEEHSKEYWRIIIGPWLGWFIQMIFDRWSMIEKAYSQNNDINVRLIKRNLEEFIPNDMDEFTKMISEDKWNEFIYGEIIGLMGIDFSLIDSEDSINTTSKTLLSLRVIISKLKRFVLKILNRIFSFFSSNKSLFFITTYLPRKQELLLQFYLKQLPFFWIKENFDFKNIEIDQRNLPQENHQDFEHIVRILVKRHLPLSYKEGYKGINRKIQKLPWPNNPKLIFTSNSWSNDDIFKIYAANKVDSGSKLILGQHGGHYGMGLWSFLEDHQFKVSNHFLTWGWSESPQNNCLPLGNIKNFGKKGSYNKKGNALLIGMSGSRYSMHMYSSPVAGQWLEYFNEEVKFYNNLPKSIQVDLTVRLLSEDYGWCQKERWEDLFSGIKLDIGKIPLEKQVINSRISISSYNATTYLETLSQNIPTMIFWNPKQWELRDSALPNFDKLKSVGIFHEDPKAAALHLINIWDDIESWWNTNELQTAREEFCQTYAYIPLKPSRHTVDVFKSLISEE